MLSSPCGDFCGVRWELSRALQSQPKAGRGEDWGLERDCGFPYGVRTSGAAIWSLGVGPCFLYSHPGWNTSLGLFALHSARSTPYRLSSPWIGLNQANYEMRNAQWISYNHVSHRSLSAVEITSE